MADKKTILMLSDHPLSTSGVGTQARWLIHGLINTGKYSFRCFGGAGVGTGSLPGKGEDFSGNQHGLGAGNFYDTDSTPATGCCNGCYSGIVHLVSFVSPTIARPAGGHYSSGEK